MNFEYQNQCRILFGQGQIKAIKPLIDAGDRIMFIYGGGSIKRNGVYRQVMDALTEFKVIEFSGVEPNPTIETLNKAVEQVKQHKVDFILAVGGGSVIDGAKYVAAAALYAGNGWDLVSGQAEISNALPLGSILTLPATGSEANIGSVVTRAATQDKRAFASECIRPIFAIMDPDVMTSLPYYQLVNGVIDAWVHVCEQYITYPTENRVQDGIAEAILKTLLHLGNTFEQHAELSWRSNLMWCANQATNGQLSLSQPLDWSTHMIAHEFTTLFGVDHAPSLTMVHTHLLRTMIEEKRVKLEQMGRNVFGLTDEENLAENTINTIEAFYLQMGTPIHFLTKEMSADEAIDAILVKLAEKDFNALGENQTVTPVRVREVLLSSLK